MCCASASFDCAAFGKSLSYSASPRGTTVSIDCGRTECSDDQLEDRFEGGDDDDDDDEEEDEEDDQLPGLRQKYTSMRGGSHDLSVCAERNTFASASIALDCAPPWEKTIRGKAGTAVDDDEEEEEDDDDDAVAHW